MDASRSDVLATQFLQLPKAYGRDLDLRPRGPRRVAACTGRGSALPAEGQAPAGSWLLLYGPAGGSAAVIVD